MTEFFMPMIPPTATKQARGWGKTKSGKVISYDRANAATEGKLTSYLAQHIPPKPYTGAIRLTVKWMFPLKGKHYDGEWYTNKPDYDNLPKAMNDIMTKLGYWKDDCIIASGITEKFWSATPGIYVRIEELKPSCVKRSGCYVCQYGDWGADGCTCKLDGLLVRDPRRGCECQAGEEVNEDAESDTEEP